MEIRVLVEPQQGASYAELARFAQAAENAGIDGFFVSDHLLRIGDEGAERGPTDSWTTLAGLARETRTIRLGTLVSPVTFRPPGLLAIVVAEVHDMSDGRIELGLGAGWYEAEHLAMGLDFPSARGRLERLEEQLAIVTGLWSASDENPFSFNGRHYTLAPSGGLSKFVHGPRPRIILGGRGGAGIVRLAGLFADELNVLVADAGRLELIRERARTACQNASRDPGSLLLSAMQTGCVGATQEEFIHRARAISREPGELLQQAIAGSVNDAIEKLRALARVGIRRVYLQMLDLNDLDQLSLIGSELVPQARSL